MEVPEFGYMRWAKAHSGAHEFDLTPSAVPVWALPPVERPSANRSMPVGDGDPVCERLIGARYSVPEDHVLFVPGTTLGNFLLLFAHVEPGEPVLVEHPVYENLPGLVRLLRGEVRFVVRRPEDGYALDLRAVEEGFAAGARTLLLTDLHNPTGVRLTTADLASLRGLAARHGARVLLDEVYRDFRSDAPATAYLPKDPTVLVASSLTKVYGLGALRAGWVLAPPEVRGRLARLLDYLTVLPPAPVAGAAEAALRQADEILERSRSHVAAGRRVFEEWLSRRPEMRWVPPDGGVAALLRVEGISDAGPLCDWLLRERDTAVVPGRFFGDPAAFRLAFGIDPKKLAGALKHLGEAIDRHRAGRSE
jgi:aspartate/methionine/tyrosine aminotransferase